MNNCRLALVVMACLCAAGCGESQAAKLNREAAKAVLYHGGTFTAVGMSTSVRDPTKAPKKAFYLERINLNGTGVTDEDLEPFQELRQVQDLALQDAAITDAGLARLKGLKKLRTLSLYKTGVTDKGLEELRDFKNLQKLDLSYTAVTDAGLEQLAGLKGLQQLYLHGTPVTNEGVAKLKQSLPNCKIQK